MILNDNNFDVEVLQAEGPVLVDFWAEWCGPCKALGPVIEALAADNEGKAKVGKVDVDVNVKLRQKYGIRSIPTLMLFKNGEVVNDKVSGRTKAELQAVIDAA